MDLGLLNFYIIVESGGALLIDDFDPAHLEIACKVGNGDLAAVAARLVLDFQAKEPDTEAQELETKEAPNGPVPISLPNLPGNV